MRDRLLSLDALRGFDMFWIIGGAAIFEGLAKALPHPALLKLTEQFEHVPWQGLHFFDVIWPLFMFMVGVSIPLSLARRQAAGAKRRELLGHAIRRSLILFLLGAVAQGHLLAFDLSKFWPCYSVLHGIAAGYLIATILALYLRPLQQAVAMALFLLLYWALLMLIPVPGVGAGVLTPTGNAATWIDQLILGRFHHGTNTWFLSYLGFASSVMLGVLTGEFLGNSRPDRKKAAQLALAGAGVLLLGLLWSLWFPVIKLLWTSTFVLVGGGLSCLLFSAFYFLIDVQGYRRWTFPFVVIGMNSIAAYMAMMLFDFRQIGNIFVGGLLLRIGPWKDFLESAAAFAVLWLILNWMHRTKTFVKI